MSLTQTNAHFSKIVDAIASEGRFSLIEDPESLDITKFERESASVHWELMFTRSLFCIPHMNGLQRLLDEDAAPVHAGLIRTTRSGRFGTRPT